jgi:hypothetical protein
MMLGPEEEERSHGEADQGEGGRVEREEPDQEARSGEVSRGCRSATKC